MRTLLENLKKSVPFSGGLLISVVPRGGLQIAQPAHVPEALLKSYSRGFDMEDRLSWQTIFKGKPLRASDVYGRDELDETSYVQDLLQPQGYKYALALPLAAPVLEGYPGVVHVFRAATEGDFTGKEIEALMGVIHQFDAKRQGARNGKNRSSNLNQQTAGDSAAVAFAIVDGKLKSQYNAAGLAALDHHLRDQMLDHAKRRMHQVNGHGPTTDRIQVPDSHGDVWVFRLISFKKFPALGEGSYTFICRQPACTDWGQVKPQDFQADSELSRLIPAIKFMQQEFSHGPTLVDIAKEVHLSPFHFHRRFTELLGLTPKQYLLDCQIHEAKTELLAREKELSQIAKDCGFAHQSHFTSRFKQASGLTPTRWRRMMNDRQRESDN
ncbi:MAG TPA: AraC family transcriptional regulator [Tepidisphaeraceae bacterium]|nr:AraC family transcriptional regulator [Tepidisphaeraceae bacterium]